MKMATTSTIVYQKVFFSSRRRHTRYWRDWSSDVCSSDLDLNVPENHVYVCFGVGKGTVPGAGHNPPEFLAADLKVHHCNKEIALIRVQIRAVFNTRVAQRCKSQIRVGGDLRIHVVELDAHREGVLTPLPMKNRGCHCYLLSSSVKRTCRRTGVPSSSGPGLLGWGERLLRDPTGFLLDRSLQVPHLQGAGESRQRYGQRERWDGTRWSAAVVVLPVGDRLIGRAAESLPIWHVGRHLLQPDAGQKECACIHGVVPSPAVRLG